MSGPSSSSYVSHTVRLLANTQSTSSASFKQIAKIDDTIDKLSSIIDDKLVAANGSALDRQQDLVAEIVKLARIIEELSEKKAQLAVKNYDLIDHNMKIVDRQLKVIQRVKRSHPNNMLTQDNCEEGSRLAQMGSFDNSGNVHDNTFKSGHGSSSAAYLASTQTGKKKRVETADEYAIDPNEPVYCLCRQVAYGAMVQCDEEACEVEWFHYPCVNLSKNPKSRWICPNCTKRKG